MQGKKYKVRINLYQKYHLCFLCEDLIRDVHNLNCQNGADWDEANSNPEKFADFDKHFQQLTGYCKAIQMYFELDKHEEKITIYGFNGKMLYKIDGIKNNILDDVDRAATELGLNGW